MSDFLIIQGATGHEAARVLDRYRCCGVPAASELVVGPLGVAWRPVPGRGCAASLSEAGVGIAVGRPRVTAFDWSKGRPDGVTATLCERFSAASGSADGDPHRSVTGMYAFAWCDSGGVTVVTDRMGSRPVYIAHANGGAVVRAIGTHPEAVARAGGLATAFDVVSIAELIAFNAVTFPYTTRSGMRELPPASTVRFDDAEGGLRLSRTHSWWIPREPDAWPGREEAEEGLYQALRTAGDDTTAGCERVAVSLSGGLDSRAVMGAIPRNRLHSGLTYAGRSNEEVAVAAEVAGAFDVSHILCQRAEDLYERMMPIGLTLIGGELRAATHGLCVAEAGMTDRFDVLVGGQLSDTLLKDHYMPPEERDRWRTRSLRERITAPLRTRGQRRVSQRTIERSEARAGLSPEMQEAVRARRGARLDEILAIRPRTAEEWIRFWPLSRQDDSAHTLGNSRLMASETMFNHPEVFAASAELSPSLRWAGLSCHRVFARLYGASARIRNANTGLLPGASPRAEARAKRRLKQTAAAPDPADPRPWNDARGSWVSLALLQQRSEIYGRRRMRAMSDDAVRETLCGVLEPDRLSALSRYDDRLPATVNAMACQLAVVIDAAERDSTPIEREGS